ncbi:MAG TPA: hypothetical protein VEQ66_10280 [Propionibacteriaceae bacterium]|nr:hypothetical protein [Propionibacteriaceae bacterium]
MARTGLAVGAAVVVVALLPTVSCSSRAANEAPPAGSAPTKVAPSTTATLNPETSLERRTRLDQEAAVKAYRAALAESDRLFLMGGAEKPSKKLKLFATGRYLDLVAGGLAEVKANEWHGTAPTKVIYAAAQGSGARITHIKACEDVSKARLLDKKGRDRTPAGHRRYVQAYTLSKTSDGWKVSDLDSRPVPNFAGYGCEL